MHEIGRCLPVFSNKSYQLWMPKSFEPVVRSSCAVGSEWTMPRQAAIQLSSPGPTGSSCQGIPLDDLAVDQVGHGREDDMRIGSDIDAGSD